ncbi:MAG TPA: hypothetical protein VHO47_04730 [Candidatus Babeliales bacterium]|nr:hypothetical protein [Candidatus Babeliales bacterium]
MKKNIKKLLCAALFLAISSQMLPAEGWNIPLVSKFSEFTKTRQAAIFVCGVWTVASLAESYNWYKDETYQPAQTRKKGILINAAMAPAAIGLGLAIYAWPHLKSLYS